MFVAWLSSAGTLISLAIGGGWYDTTDVTTLNQLAAIRQANVLGVWSIPVPNLDFVLSGIGAMVSFNFAFFRGELAILQWFMLTVISSAVLFGLFALALGTASTLWRR